MKDFGRFWLVTVTSANSDLNALVDNQSSGYPHATLYLEEGDENLSDPSRKLLCLCIRPLGLRERLSAYFRGCLFQHLKVFRNGHKSVYTVRP